MRQLVEHIFFKISYPAEVRVPTAAEAVVALHPPVKDRLDDIGRILAAGADQARLEALPVHGFMGLFVA